MFLGSQIGDLDLGILLAPVDRFDDFDQDILLNPDVDQGTVENVDWDGGSAYEIFSFGTNARFRSEFIDTTGPYPALSASWTGSGLGFSSIELRVTTDGGLNWCQLSNGGDLAGTVCDPVLQVETGGMAYGFFYQFDFADNSQQAALDSVTFSYDIQSFPVCEDLNLIVQGLQGQSCGTGAYYPPVDIDKDGDIDVDDAVAVANNMFNPQWCLDRASDFTDPCGTISEPFECSDLQAYYRFEGDSDDDSGNGFDGSEVGGFIYNTGMLGQAIDFDGLTGYVDTGYGPTYGQNNNFSFSAWIYPRGVLSGDNMKVGGAIADGVQGGTVHLGFDGVDCGVDGAFSFAVGDSDQPLERDVACGVDGWQEEWHHVVGVYSAGNDPVSRTVSVWVDNSEIGSVPITSASDGNKDFTSGNSWYLGALNNLGTSTDFFDGLLDEVTIWAQTLDSSDIGYLHNAGQGREICDAVQVPVCGDGQLEGFEQCDDGLVDPDDTIYTEVPGDDDGDCVIDIEDSASSCLNNVCGDGYLYAGEEQCDDGNLVAGDGCDALCRFETSLGPVCSTLYQLILSSIGSFCGDVNYDLRADLDNDGNVDSFDLLTMGNNAQDENWCQGELDDTTDPCFTGCVDDSECVDTLYCNGAETCNVGLGECEPGTPVVCDDGISCSVDSCNEASDSCDFDLAGCSCVNDGDCDDSNSCTDDSCNAQLTCDNVNNDANSCTDSLICTINDRCSAGSCISDPEVVDDGVACTVDSCSEIGGVTNTPDDNLCTGAQICDPVLDCVDPPAQCGNGLIETGEECDDGLVDADDTYHTVDDLDDDGDCVIDIEDSASSCLNNVCGDGYLYAGEEQCDDGNLVAGDGCDSSCQIEIGPGDVCGNGLVEAGEECDDGNVEDGDGCSSLCELEQCAISCVVDIDLALDGSGSMNNAIGGSAQSKWEVAKTASSTFLTNLLDASNVDYDNLAGFIVFNETIRNGHDLTQDLVSIDASLVAYDIDIFGATNFNQSIRLSVDRILDQGRTGAHKFVLLLSDGVPNQPHEDTPAGPLEMEDSDYKSVIEAVDYAIEKNIPVITIGFSDSTDPLSFNETLMIEIATKTGGQYYPAVDSSALDQVFSDLTDQVCLQSCTPLFVCGNNILEVPYEECDDGNLQDGDGCDSQCIIGVAPGGDDGGSSSGSGGGGGSGYRPPTTPPTTPVTPPVVPDVPPTEVDTDIETPEEDEEGFSFSRKIGYLVIIFILLAGIVAALVGIRFAWKKRSKNSASGSNGEDDDRPDTGSKPDTPAEKPVEERPKPRYFSWERPVEDLEPVKVVTAKDGPTNSL